MKKIVLGLLLPWLGGCVGMAGVMGAHVKAYPGDERPIEELAVFLPAGSGSAYAMLSRVDGKLYGEDLVLGFPSDVRVLPGDHFLTLQCSAGQKKGLREINVKVEAGHFYYLQCYNADTGFDAGLKNLGTTDPRKKKD